MNPSTVREPICTKARTALTDSATRIFSFNSTFARHHLDRVEALLCLVLAVALVAVVVLVRVAEVLAAGESLGSGGGLVSSHICIASSIKILHKLDILLLSSLARRSKA